MTGRWRSLRLRVLRLPPAYASPPLAAMCMALTLVVGMMDLLLPPAVTLRPFYAFLIIGAVVWGGGMAGVTVTAMALAFCAFDALSDWPSHLPVPTHWEPTLAMMREMVDLSLTMVLTLWGATLYGRERRLSRTDQLTTLANRLGFWHLLEHELARHFRMGRTMTLAYLDCDNFKAVNDRLGHAEGDRLLQAVARTLRRVLRKSDCVARLGGDEFAVMLLETDRAQARIALDKAALALDERMEAQGWPVTFSIGAVEIGPRSVSAAEALELADRAMYAVKKAGKSGVLIADECRQPPPGRKSPQPNDGAPSPLMQ